MEKTLSFVTTQESQSAGITIKSARELERMREAGRVVGITIQTLRQALEPGMRTRDLDLLAAQEIQRMGARPAFKGYRGFPATICVSVNNEIVHGIPGPRVIREGDLVSMDVGAIVDGFHGDAAVTIAAGQVSPELQALLEVTEQALYTGIRAARASARVGDIGAAVQGYVESRGKYGIVTEYVGHGIGRSLHEEPSIANIGPGRRGALLRPGMTIAIEPMVNLGGWQTRVLEDQWTVVTADDSSSAHFEHTLAITEDGPKVLTVP